MRRLASLLMEHCDSVQIIGTVYDQHTKETHAVNAGDGNWYARVGATKEFLDRAEADVFAKQVEADSEDEE